MYYIGSSGTALSGCQTCLLSWFDVHVLSAITEVAFIDIIGHIDMQEESRLFIASSMRLVRLLDDVSHVAKVLNLDT